LPPSGLSACKSAIFAAGAGRYPDGKYTECCWTTSGRGQFRPRKATNPAIGRVGELEFTEEVWVEGLKRAHPYEQPSYSVSRMEEF
ncbi:structural toxin protein RtxA, partial [Aspergillus heteromorphus CBS 117.55]